VNVGRIQGIGEVAVGPLARVRHQIDLGEARLVNIPAIGSERNVMLQQCLRLRPSILPPLQRLAMRPEQPIHLPRADAQQASLGGGREAQPATRPRHPRGQQRL
jgi:hypothetical protein